MGLGLVYAERRQQGDIREQMISQVIIFVGMIPNPSGICLKQNREQLRKNTIIVTTRKGAVNLMIYVTNSC